MKEEDNKEENICSKPKKIVKFVRRHFFTLFVSYFIAKAILAGPIQGENACGFLLGAILLDWAKQFMKPNPSYDKRDYDDPLNQPIHKQWWNPNILGTSANHIRDAGRYTWYD